MRIIRKLTEIYKQLYGQGFDDTNLTTALGKIGDLDLVSG